MSERRLSDGGGRMRFAQRREARQLQSANFLLDLFLAEPERSWYVYPDLLRAFRLRSRRLYRALRRLEEAGLITADWDGAIDGRPPRRRYRLAEPASSKGYPRERDEQIADVLRDVFGLVDQAVDGITDAQVENRLAALVATSVPSITCPRCGMTSHNPNDVEQGYCGNCHDWTREARPEPGEQGA
jgi:DNA-binding transcriptional ArsR family regulator